MCSDCCLGPSKSEMAINASQSERCDLIAVLNTMHLTLSNLRKRSVSRRSRSWLTKLLKARIDTTDFDSNNAVSAVELQ
jgi:hypothetical protein